MEPGGKSSTGPALSLRRKELSQNRQNSSKYLDTGMDSSHPNNEPVTERWLQNQNTASLFLKQSTWARVDAHRGLSAAGGLRLKEKRWLLHAGCLYTSNHVLHLLKFMVAPVASLPPMFPEEALGTPPRPCQCNSNFKQTHCMGFQNCTKTRGVCPVPPQKGTVNYLSFIISLRNCGCLRDYSDTQTGVWWNSGSWKSILFYTWI